jgi:pectate lyase
MKHFSRFILILSLFFMAATGSAQVQLSENFDSGNSIPTSSGSAPSVATDYSTSSGTWTLFKSYRHGTANYSAPYAIRLLKNDPGAYIITPSLNTVGTISFWGYASASRPLYFYKSTDDGDTWIFLDSVFTGDGSFVFNSVEVNDLSPDIKIKIENGTVGGNDLNIDNIEITSYTTDAMISLSLEDLPDFGPIESGEISSSVSYTVEGNNLSDDILILSSSNFEISLNNSTFSDTIILPQSAGSVEETTVYVRFKPASAVGNINENIVHTSSDALTKNLNVSGTSIAIEPTSQSNISFGNVSGNSIDVNFSGGNGSRRILVAKANSIVNWAPTDGNLISGVNSNFSSASNQFDGNKVVYDGSGNSILISGLTGSTTYHFAVYEYNIGTGNSQNYFIISPGIGNQTTLAVPTLSAAPSSLLFGNITINTISDEKTFTLSGNTLSPSNGNIEITAPSGFEISLSSGSGFSSAIQIPYTGSTLASQIIYVRFLPVLIENYSGSILISGGTASPININVSGNGKSPSEPNVFQSEDGLMNRGHIQNDYTGYTGSGYVFLVARMGAWNEVVFKRNSAASDTVTVQYANGSGGTRTLNLSLNGSDLGNISFPKTDSWSIWTTLKIVVPLVEGINNLRLTTTGNSTNPFLDKIVIGGASAMPVYKLDLLKSGNGIVSSSLVQEYFDAGTEITVTASASGNDLFTRWFGTHETLQNPLTLSIDEHTELVGIFLDTTGLANFSYEESPRGFASLNALGNNGTTGGAGRNSIIVDNGADLWNIMFDRQDPNKTKNLAPLTVYILGVIDPDPAVFGGSKMLDVKDAYNISIIGIGNDAAITGFGLKIFRSINIIVRNIKFAACPDDGIAIDANDDEAKGHHIWIDHCTFTDTPPAGFPSFGSYDGALDITHTAAYVTVSWCHFTNHSKNSLVGHSNSNAADTAIKVTYHHNYFDGTDQRNPRVRFGKVHVYNNYFRNNSIYGVSSNCESDIVVEGNYFVNVPIPTESGRDGGPDGDIIERFNIFVNSGTPETRGTAFEPSHYYSYSLDNAVDIPDKVSQFAGSGKYDFSAGPDGVIPVELIFFSAVIKGSDIILNWKTATETNNLGFEIERKSSNNSSWSAIGFVDGSGTSSTGINYFYTDKNLSSGKYYYRLKQIDYDGTYEYSNEAEINLNIPSAFVLHQNYPNPFNPQTTIRFEISEKSLVNISVFNLLGEKVSSVMEENLDEGSYQKTFDAASLASGIYIYRISAGKFSASKKMVVLK